MDRIETTVVVKNETRYAISEKEYWEIQDALREILKDCAYEVHYNDSILNEHTKRTLMRCLMSAKRIQEIVK